jgi:RNA-directed DNA polymerase
VPLPARRQVIPKDGGKVRLLLIPAIRDQMVQGALGVRGKKFLG